MDLAVAAAGAAVAALLGLLANWLLRSRAGDRFEAPRWASPRVEPGTDEDTVQLATLRPLVPSALDQLEVVAGLPYQSWILPDDAVIGRDERSDVVVDDVRVSRQHARLSRRDGRRFISDLESVNGLIVNGVRVDNRELSDGDLVQFGDVVLRYRKSA